MEVNAFDVLKTMSLRNMKIKAFHASTNLKSANSGKSGWGSITLAVDNQTIMDLLNNTPLICMLIVADGNEFDIVKDELAREAQAQS